MKNITHLPMNRAKFLKNTIYENWLKNRLDLSYFCFKIFAEIKNFSHKETPGLDGLISKFYQTCT